MRRCGGIREYRKTQCKLLQTVRNNLKTRSPIPDWAASKVAESWNVPTSDADRNQEPGAAAASAVATPGTVAQSDKRRVVRKTHPSTIVPSRGALAEPLQGLECLMAGTKANIPLALSWVTRRSGRNSRVPAPSHRIEGSALPAKKAASPDSAACWRSLMVIHQVERWSTISCSSDSVRKQAI